MIDYYVNTDTGNNSWDGTSPTYVSGTTGPKATLNGALALLGTLTDSVTIHCKGATADASATRCDFKTTTSDYRLIIQVDEADRHKGIWDETKYRLVGGEQNFGANYCVVIGVQVKLVDSGSTLRRAVGISGVEAGGSEILLDACIITADFSGNTAASNCVGLYVADADAVVTARNSIIHGIHNNPGGGTYGQGVQLTGGTLTLENCTVVGCGGEGIYRGGGTLNLVNTYVGGNGDSDIAGTVNSYTTCACEDNISATGLTPNIAFDTTEGAGHAGFHSVTPGDSDYLKPKSGSVLVGAGTDQAYTEDIAGNTRSSTYDIGAFEFIPPVGGGGGWAAALLMMGVG
jgi:hypothetical protein